MTEPGSLFMHLGNMVMLVVEAKVMVVILFAVAILVAAAIRKGELGLFKDRTQVVIRPDYEDFEVRLKKDGEYEYKPLPEVNSKIQIPMFVLTEEQQAAEREFNKERRRSEIEAEKAEKRKRGNLRDFSDSEDEEQDSSRRRIL